MQEKLDTEFHCTDFQALFFPCDTQDKTNLVREPKIQEWIMSLGWQNKKRSIIQTVKNLQDTLGEHIADVSWAAVRYSNAYSG